jgi:hypothetical protein
MAWGCARWLALAGVVLLLACLTDWLLDRSHGTPWSLRVLMFAAQAALWLGAAWFFLLRPLFTRLRDGRLALWVERRQPELEHRLISTVQLNQRGARTEGMSPELIAAVTRETERMAQGIDFPSVADHRRLRWSAALAAPVLLGGALLVLLVPATALALLARQMLADVDVPRSVYLESVTKEIWPSGEEVVLRFRVRGESLAPDLRGEAEIYPEDGGPAERYELAYESSAAPGEAVYTARVRPMSTDYQYRAWLGDGRTKRTARVHFEPRPAIVRQEAWVLLPEYCGLKPDGTPYELPQARGEIVGMSGLSARVQVTLQKPIRQAVLEILGTPYPDLSRPGRDSATQRHHVEALSGASALGLLAAPAAGPLEAATGLQVARGEIVLRRLPQSFPDGKSEVQWTFDLRPTETAYRIEVLDRYDFASAPRPPRGILIAPERPPQVALLRERFLPRKTFVSKGPDEDFEVDGMPLPIDRTGKAGKIRIAYSAAGPYGLGHARLRYRVLRKAEGSQEEAPAREERWLTLPLREVPAEADAGPFDPKHGVFQNSDDDEEVPFHAAPSPDRWNVLPRTLGGGRFEFDAGGIPDGKGGLIRPREGDQIEFFVEVVNRNPNAEEAVVGRSETRVKTVVSDEDFIRWSIDVLQEESRLRQLEQKQRGVFGGK